MSVQPLNKCYVNKALADMTVYGIKYHWTFQESNNISAEPLREQRGLSSSLVQN